MSTIDKITGNSKLNSNTKLRKKGRVTTVPRNLNSKKTTLNLNATRTSVFTFCRTSLNRLLRTLMSLNRRKTKNRKYGSIIKRTPTRLFHRLRSRNLKTFKMMKTRISISRTPTMKINCFKARTISLIMITISNRRHKTMS